MFYKLRVRLNKRFFDFRCREAFSLPPAPPPPKGNLKIVSMVCHADMTMYLLAAKSFQDKVGMGEIVVLDDGSLTAEDQENLRRHLRPAAIVPIRSVANGACPKGGCWERLLYIAGAAADSYVIQLDSDTLTVDAVPEVVQAVRENRPFLLGTRAGKQVEGIEVAVKRMEDVVEGESHVQAVSEKNFDKLRGYPGLRYARACAGFSGFPAGEDLRGRVEDFSRQMEAAIGAEKWHKWGSEQVASNYVLSNLDGALVLPYPRYSEFNPADGDRGGVFMHFIGNYRWEKSEYIRRGRSAIQALRMSGRVDQ